MIRLRRIMAKDGGAEAFLASYRARAEADSAAAEKVVAAVIADIRRDGDKALLSYTERFDGARLPASEVPRKAVSAALDKVDPAFLSALRRAADNIRDFHERQTRQSWFVTGDGTLLGQRVRPLKRVGVYVPGGTASYPSSVLMNVLPAKAAGVPEVCMATPPRADGTVNPRILAAAAVAGVDRVFAMGGAQAVAAFAYGTESVPRVDKIVGPGNIYVATAKRLVFGAVDIDMIAGPSEILVLADQTANPAFVAADLLSQAEHDPLSSSILVTTCSRLADDVDAELSRRIESLPRKDIIKRALSGYGAAVLCADMDEAVDMANELAPEHLEVMTKDPMSLLGRLDNAGSVFLGPYSPEPLGDYFAGPNHVLPTSGTARFFSPLSAESFVKVSSFIRYGEDALRTCRGDIVALARAEGLDAHAESVEARFCR